MKIKRIVRASALASLLAGVTGPVIAGQPSVVLAPPEMIKVEWDSRALTSADFDSDGRQDLAVINNEDARIDLYYQLAPGEKAGETERETAVDRWEPQLDDARFERVKVQTGVMAYDMAFGDLNGDERPDLVYSNDRNELVVHHQGEKGDWSAKQIHEFEELSTLNGSLFVEDLQGDEKPELVAIVPVGFLIFPDGKLDVRPTRYFCVYDDPRGLEFQDMNGDGRLDLVYFYLNGGKESLMVIRFQSEDGRFVGERFFGYERSASFPAHLNWGSDSDSSKGTQFVTISSANRTVTSLTAGPLDEKASDEELASRDFQRTAYAVPTSGSKGASFAVADFTGDGLMDLVASDGPGAQVWFFQQRAGSMFSAPESFPAFSEISGLAAEDLDGDGRAELIMMSEKEGLLGVTRFSKERRFAYPDTVPLSGVPVAMTVGRLTIDGAPVIVCAVEGESNRKRSLFKASPAEGDDEDWKVEPLTEEEVASRLEALRLTDINQDGRSDLLVLSSVQATEILLLNDKGAFVRAEGSVAGLSDKVAPRAITEGDLNGDGTAELLVTRETFTRSARLSEAGRPEVLDQINAPDVSANLLVSAAADVDGDKQAELLLVDSNSEKVHVMARDDKGVYRLRRSHPGVDELQSSFVGDADGDGRQDLFLFGKTNFWWYSLRPSTFGIEEKQLYETDLKDVIYASMLVGEMDGDGKDDLVLFDNANSYMMEMLLTGAAGSTEDLLRSALHFKLFEVDPHFQGQRGGRFQPYAGLMEDLNGDGREDVALLMHNRLVIYAQQ